MNPHLADLADQALQPGAVAHHPRIARHSAAQGLEGCGRQFGRGLGRQAVRARITLSAHGQTGAGPEHRRFQQRIGGQPIGAVHPGGGALAHGIEAGQRGAPVLVGHHPAHVIVRRRRHRDRLDTRVHTRRHARGEHSGEFLGEVRAHRLAGIEEGAFARGDLPVDGAGHNVARGQLGLGVIALHEGAALSVDQPGALAAQSLGGQGRGVDIHGDGRGVKLHEFRIGDLGARQGCQGQALAAHGGGHGGHGIETAQAPGGQDHGAGHDLDLTAAEIDQGAAHATVLILQQSQGAALTEQNVPGRFGGVDHRLHDGLAGLVALDPRHAGPRVGRLQALHEPAAGLAVEGRAQGRQTLNGGRTLAGKEARHVRIDQTRARRDGVRGMQLGIVVRRQGHGHPALGPGR